MILSGTENDLDVAQMLLNVASSLPTETEQGSRFSDILNLLRPIDSSFR